MSGETDKLFTDASIWLARLERGLQPQEGALLREWLKVPAQRDTIVELAKLHHGPDIVAVLADLVPVGFGTPAPPMRKGWSPVKAIIGIVIGVIALGPWIAIIHQHRAAYARSGAPANFGAVDRPYRPQDPILPWGQQTYTTKLGEIRTVNLADGSRLVLNGHSQAVVLFGMGSRSVSVKYGEAMLDIMHPRERLFDVDAGGRHFQAPVSKFNIRVNGPGDVELTVMYGVVTVLGMPWHLPATPAEARLFDPRIYSDSTVGPMQSAVLEEGTITRYPLTADIRSRLSWEPVQVVYATP